MMLTSAPQDKPLESTFVQSHLFENIFVHISGTLLTVLVSGRPHFARAGADGSDCCLWVVSQRKICSIVGVHASSSLLLEVIN